MVCQALDRKSRRGRQVVSAPYKQWVLLVTPHSNHKLLRPRRGLGEIQPSRDSGTRFCIVRRGQFALEPVCLSGERVSVDLLEGERRGQLGRAFGQLGGVRGVREGEEIRVVEALHVSWSG